MPTPRPVQILHIDEDHSGRQRLASLDADGALWVGILRTDDGEHPSIVWRPVAQTWESEP